MPAAHKNFITSRELAARLLELPDFPVVGIGVGQGGNENQDEPLVDVTIDRQNLRVELRFEP